MKEVARNVLEINNLDKVLIRSLLYQTLGVKPSESMLKLYEMIKKEDYNKKTGDLFISLSGHFIKSPPFR